jgi:hypothetical protein
MEQELLYAHDPTTTDAERIQNIIESRYTPADLNKIGVYSSGKRRTETTLKITTKI